MCKKMSNFYSPYCRVTREAQPPHQFELDLSFTLPALLLLILALPLEEHLEVGHLVLLDLDCVGGDLLQVVICRH